MPNFTEIITVWLRIKNWYFLQVSSLKEVEIRLHEIPAFSLGTASFLPSRIKSVFYSLYQGFFDDWGPEYSYYVSTMKELEILNHVRCLTRKFIEWSVIPIGLEFFRTKKNFT